MGHDSPAGWLLVRFGEHLDLWEKLEAPDLDTRLMVVGWVMTRQDDPYVDVRREAGFQNLWFGRIPGTLDGNSSMVICSYFIFESTKIVRCNSICRLSLPV